MAWGQFRLFLLLSSFLLFTGASAALLGGWRPIKNVNDQHLRQIGEFAVTEHNKEAATALKFESLVKGETQVVSGTNYRLTLTAKNGAVSSKYQTVVWEKLDGTKKLTSFKPI